MITMSTLLRRAGMSTALLSTVALLAAPTSQAAAPNLTQYTLKNCGSGFRHHIDPMNVVFFGRNATPGLAASDLKKLAGWTDRGGSKQSFLTRGQCFDMDRNAADGCALCARYHLRLFAAADTNSKGSAFIEADAHHDSYAACRHHVGQILVLLPGHKASTFNGGRAIVREAWFGHHTIFNRYWGNTQRMKQCDNSYTRSDGNVLYAGI